MDVRFGSIRAFIVALVAGIAGSASEAAASFASPSEPPEFIHLNYSRMTADEAFEGETLLVAMTVPVSEVQVTQELQPQPIHPTGSSAKSEPAGEPSGNDSGRIPQHTDASLQQPASDVTKPRSSQVTIRSLQAVNLFDATSPETEDGKPLETPRSNVPTEKHRVEEQFVPLPWHRSHPPRNTFAFRHQPLYFEDPNLERCGDSYGCLTEAVSIAHFAGRIPLLPYMMASDNPHETIRGLKDCPAGCSFGPDAYLPRPTVKAIAVEAAAVTGFIFVIP